MSTFLIEYDLTQPGQNYDDLITYIKSFPSWANHLKSAWFVTTNLTAAQVLDGVVKYLDANDKVMVINVSGASAAWYGLTQELTDWIKKNL